ncbi:MAG: anti-sigma28 factor (negative regulator of flagellin synthesis) [Myxococcota bacterium]|jgi:anti-sigma28 factor (negative regulator of flagellin synthesis)
MDVKVSPSRVDVPKARAQVAAVRSDGSDTTIGKQSTPTDATRTAKATDTSATSALQELGRDEAQQLHSELIAELRDQVRSGTYQPHAGAVAERVAEVLGAV